MKHKMRAQHEAQHEVAKAQQLGQVSNETCRGPKLIKCDSSEHSLYRECYTN